MMTRKYAGYVFVFVTFFARVQSYTHHTLLRNVQAHETIPTTTTQVRSYRLDSKEIDRNPIQRDEIKSFTVKTIKAQLRLMDISCKKAINRNDIEQLFFDFYEDIPSYSSAELKDKLRLAGVDDSKCVEKSDLVTLLRQSIHCNVRGKFDGWVRSFNKSGGLSWISPLGG